MTKRAWEGRGKKKQGAVERVWEAYQIESECRNQRGKDNEDLKTWGAGERAIVMHRGGSG